MSKILDESKEWNNSILPKIIKYDSMIDYQDGSEAVLLDIVKSEDFDELLTWRNYTKNWALYYHLAPHRKNIINWLNFGNEPIKILELGAGCGAITSGLVKIENAQITAVEGSLARAKVIQERCSKAKNLEIHVCNINDYSSGEKYDIVSLIGVLEYSGRYSEESEPFHWLLSYAQKLLKDDGVLFLAIENKLGHKYLSGTVEDHYGKPWEGINNYPNYSGVKTFDSKELSDMLKKAGLLSQQWYYPYPDYKLPGIVISEDAINSKDFDWLPLFNIPDEPNMSQSPTFNERTFLNSLDNLECAKFFMNSFCIIAGKSEIPENRFNASSFLAYKSTIKHRNPRYHVDTFFEKENTGKIKVIKVPVGNQNEDNKYLKHVIDKEPQKYYSGYKTIHDMIIDSLFNANFKDVEKYLLLWQEIIAEYSHPRQKENVEVFNEFSNEIFNKTIYEDDRNINWIDGKYLDLIPSNILISMETGEHVFIDLEWQMKIEIPSQLVFDRGMQILKGNILRKSKFISPRLNSMTALPETVHLRLEESLFLKKWNYKEVTLFDNWFQSGVFNDTLDKKEQSSINFKLELDVLDFMNNIVEKIEQGQQTEAIIYYDKHRGRYPKIAELEKFDKLISGLKNKI